MVENFKNYVKEHNLFTEEDNILLAVSGGVDSMVMCDLFIKSGYKFAIAHCNFHLREEESNRDERFVTEFAEKNNIVLYKKEFDTFSYMKENGKSLEMSARELRYKWFDELLEKHSYSFLATAHHMDDSIETFFINLLRGTGIAGLHGILQKVNRTIHPLIFTNRQGILNYQKEHNIEYVEDSTNATTQYTRNKVRHQLIPLMTELSPNFYKTMVKQVERFRETEEVFRSRINRVRSEVMEIDEDYIKIPISKLKDLKPQKIYLYEFLCEYGFNESAIYSIQDALDDISGKQFYSETHRLIKDREYLIIAKRQEETVKEYRIAKEQSRITTPLRLHAEILKDLSFIKIPKAKEIAMLDADKLKFPLKLRRWEKGDSFVPFGRKQEKKLSDFFQNLKFSLLDKENQWLLCSEDDIVWIVGQRIDDRYKIDNNTKNIYKIEVDEKGM